MTEEEKEQPQPKKGDIETIEIAAVDSPSENTLVVEHLQNLPPLIARGLVYLTLLLVLVGLVYSLVAEIDVVAECRSVARPLSHKLRVIADRTGYIERVFIAPGQEVEQNAPLFIIRSKETLSHQAKVDELRTAIPLRTEQFDQEISAARDKLVQLETTHANTLRIEELKLEQTESSLRSITADIEYWRQEVESLTTEFENTERLYERRLTSIGDYNNIKSRLQRSRTEVEKLLAQENINANEKTIISAGIENLSAEYRNERQRLGNDLDALEIDKETELQTLQGELEMNERILSLQNDEVSVAAAEESRGEAVWAEYPGTVSEVYFRNSGAYVREGELLCTLVPAGTPLYMEVTVANRDVGFIEEGMEIKYKIDAFPHFDYGTLRGKVLSISPSAVEDGAGGYVYQVEGSMGEGFFTIRDVQYRVKPGMTAVAELVIDRKSIFSILFMKLQNE